MEVKFNPGLNVDTGTSQPVVRQNQSQPADNPMSFDRTQALEKNLQAMSQVRPEAVARARALLADDDYPSDEALNQTAGVLANSLNQEQA